MSQNDPDPLLDELDEVRQRIWADCGHDPEKYLSMLRAGHEQLVREGWVEAPPREAQDKPAA